MANTNMNRQVINIRGTAGVGDISNEVLRRWSDKGYDMAVKEGNYDRSREHLNFEVVKGGKVVAVDKSRPLDKRMAEMLASRGIKDPNIGIPGTYIQNTTGAYIQLNNVSPGTGASIPASSESFPISANVEETYVFDAANYRYTVNRLANGGEITFSVSVIDSRGRRSDTVTATISVMEYALPAITAATAYRCRLDGIADEEGTYAAIRIVASYTSGSGNTLVINSTYYRSDTPESQITAQSHMTSGETYIIGNGNLDPSYAYLIRFTVTDSLGNNVIKNVNVQSSSYAIHVKNGGTGVAFGKTSEIANSVEINEGWDLYYRGVKVVPVIFSQQQPSNPFDGLVWLEPKS